VCIAFLPKNTKCCNSVVLHFAEIAQNSPLRVSWGNKKMNDSLMPADETSVALLMALVLLFTLGAYWLNRAWVRSMQERRKAFVRAYVFPAQLRHKICQIYPALRNDQVEMILQAVREYFLLRQFLLHANAPLFDRTTYLDIPSRALDMALHEFAQHRAEYKAFCKQAFGWAAQHVPTSSAENIPRIALSRTWHWACVQAGLDPQQPARLPAMFALDACLGIPYGADYRLDAVPRGGRVPAWLAKFNTSWQMHLQQAANPHAEQRLPAWDAQGRG
jgi:hypothetical protein